MLNKSIIAPPNMILIGINVALVIIWVTFKTQVRHFFKSAFVKSKFFKTIITDIVMNF